MAIIQGTRRAAAATALLCGCAGAQAAGGHFSVDDASLLEGAQCEQETWISAYRHRQQLLHAGINCRIGPVELDGAGETARADGRSAAQWNLEVKWARDVTEQWSIGLDVQPAWSVQQDPHYVGARSYVIATWSPVNRLAVNFNAGRDWWRGERDLPRGGAALEWQAIPGWTLIAERYLENETHYARAGAHWVVGRRWSLDLSHARRLAGPLPSYWSLGLTVPLGRD
jgi:hypothetical protein